MAFTWQQAREELASRRQRALQHGGEAAVARQRKAGRMLIRERIDYITDDGSFTEVGTMAVNRAKDGAGNELPPTASAYICGLATIDGRDVAIGGEDFTVNAGAAGHALDRSKGGMGGFVEKMAHEYRIPMIRSVEGAGGGVADQMEKGHAPLVSLYSFGPTFRLLGEVPLLTAALGPCAGAAAALVCASHFSVMSKDTACLFAGGPPVVSRALGRRIDKFELGGWEVHGKVSGVVDNVAENEKDAMDQIRRVLSYLPQNVWELPPFVETDDPVDRRGEELLKIIPENRRRPYQMQKVIDAIVDRGSFFEIGNAWARSLITGFARVGGYVVGVIANNPMSLGGAFDGPAAQKQTRFVELCDTFHIPLFFLVDVPGFMIGPAAEADGVLRKGTRAIQATMDTTVPIVTVHVRKAYGMACNATTNPEGLCLRLAWPTAEWGDMPIEGGVEAGFRREIESAPDPEKRRAEIEERLLEQASPWYTAEAFGVEEMIDPAETRWYVWRFLKAAQGALRTQLGPRERVGIRI